ncbi:MAG TPA: hypothetical protein VMT93_07405 [Gemmatimonadaceae bacterium]|nr:hypothetical protein [Gemmatimonadaceae bacterium]
MSPVSPARVHRSRSRLFAAAILAAAQFAVASFAPAVDGRAGAGAAAYVEDFGVRVHFAHNPDDCAACVAQSLAAAAPAAPVAFADVAPCSGVTSTVDVASPERQLWRQDAERAPPFPSAARSLN